MNTSKGAAASAKAHSVSLSIKLMVGSVLVGFSYQAFAAHWELEPHINVSETYSDNILNAPSGSESSEYITELNPGISLKGDGRRVDVGLDYQLQQLEFSNDEVSDSTFHQLRADSSINWIKHFFFTDFAVTRSQRYIDSRGNLGVGSAIASDNLTDMTLYHASPYFIYSLGRDWGGELRYKHDVVEYNAGPLDGGTDTEVLAVLRNKQHIENLYWEFTYSSHNTSYDSSNDESRFEYVQAHLGYLVSPKLEMYVESGHENNRIKVSSSVDEESSPRWLAGFRWGLSRSTRIEMAAGEQDYGAKYSASLEVNKPRQLWKLAYAERLTNLIASSNNGTGLTAAVGTPALSSDAYVDRRLDLAWNYDWGRKSIEVSAYKTRRDYRLSLLEEKTTSGNVNGTYKLTSRWEMFVGALHTVQEYATPTVTDKLSEYEFGASYALGQSGRLKGSVKKRRRDSENAGSDFVENLAMVELDLPL